MSEVVRVIVAHWFQYDSAPVYIMTLCLFVGFLNIRIRSERISHVICTVAPLTLGVYLIHAHANVSPWSWEALSLPGKMDSALFPLIQLGAVIGIFVICAAMDAARKASIGRLEQSSSLIRLCNAAEDWLSSKWSALLGTRAEE